MFDRLSSLAMSLVLFACGGSFWWRGVDFEAILCCGLAVVLMDLTILRRRLEEQGGEDD